MHCVGANTVAMREAWNLDGILKKAQCNVQPQQARDVLIAKRREKCSAESGVFFSNQAW